MQADRAAWHILQYIYIFRAVPQTAGNDSTNQPRLSAATRPSLPTSQVTGHSEKKQLSPSAAAAVVGKAFS